MGEPGQVADGKVSDSSIRAMRAYWNFYDPLVEEIGLELRTLLSGHRVFGELVRSMPEAVRIAQEQKSREIQRAAIFDGQWGPYLAELKTQGATYARAGISFGAWFDVVTALRDAVRRRLSDTAARDLAKAVEIGDGMNALLDLALATIGDAYVDAKESTIREQAEALREVSTPVLQLRDRFLLLPIVGVVDTHRARHLTEALLTAIRLRRARAVVIDVTGVPIVDSRVAKHIAQTCEAARLMGANVVITGISAEIAQTLVTIGADLSTVRTLGDLQSGLEEMERLLAAEVAVPAAAEARS